MSQRTSALDAEVIQNELEARIEVEEDVLLLIQSCGDSVGSETAKGFLAPDV